MQIMKRKEYLNKLIAFKDKNIIKIITGVHGCGKSTLLEEYQFYLKELGIDEKQIIKINLEDHDFNDLQESGNLHAYIKEHLIVGKQTYLFINEIQLCNEFPDLINIYLSKRTWIFTLLCQILSY